VVSSLQWLGRNIFKQKKDKKSPWSLSRKPGGSWDYYPLRQSCQSGCMPRRVRAINASNLDVRSSHIRRNALEDFPKGEFQEGWMGQPSSLAPARGCSNVSTLGGFVADNVILVLLFFESGKESGVV
jgi:hypothetical protein